MVYGVGALARAKAGHDKEQVFLIIREDHEYVILADGISRTLGKPKHKRKKHIQIIHDEGEPKRRKQIEETGLTDEAVKQMLQCYKRKGQL